METEEKEAKIQELNKKLENPDLSETERAEIQAEIDALTSEKKE